MSIIMFRFESISIIFFLSISRLIESQAPYEYGSSTDSDLFNTFAQSSLENIQLFKTKVFKLIETQNQYFELIQQKRPIAGDYEYSKFDVLLPDVSYRLPLLDNERLVSVPKPNVPSNFTQLLLSMDQNYRINLWQFVSDSEIVLIDKYRITQSSVDGSNADYLCIKIKSFVSMIGFEKFRLHVVALFVHKDSKLHQYGDFILVLAIDLVISGTQVLPQTNFIEEQFIRFERIFDFDILYLSTTRIYLSLIQNSIDSNFRYELALYQLFHWKIFDKISWHLTDYVLNAHRIKLAFLDGKLFLICSYDHHRSYFFESNDFDQDQSNLINVFQFIENLDAEHGNRIIFISSVNNFTSDSPRTIHHMSGNNDFFFLIKSNTIDVYWWDGHSLIYYDTIANNYPLAFALEKLLDLPPLILSTNGHDLNLYYKVYSKFIRHKLDLFIDNQYVLDQIEVFTSNQQYFVWLKFSAKNDQLVSVKHYSQFARIKTRKPESNDEIHNLDTCLNDLKDRIERGLQQITTLKRKSEDLLVITPEKPEIDVDVIVNDTFQTEQVKPQFFSLSIPGNVIRGDRMIISIESIHGRLDNLENLINNTVMLRSMNQTITSPIEFSHPITANVFRMNAINNHFYLNDVHFDTYANDSLTVNTDQTIKTNLIFAKGLQINQLYANKINNIDLDNVLLTNSNATTQFVEKGMHQYYDAYLSNGTTVERINDIRLIDIYQDDFDSKQLLKGDKIFLNISMNEIALDTTLNRKNFRQLLTKVIWLENSSVKVQRLTNNWIFSNLFVANLSVVRLINDRIRFDHFVMNVAKKDSQTLIFTVPINFRASIRIDENIFTTGLINGIDLMKEVLLLRGDQDFTENNSNFSTLLFESNVFISNLTVNLINDRFRTSSFLLRNDSDQSGIVFSNKHFKGSLRVGGNVVVKENGVINGIDISSLFYKLDTMFSLNGPVIAKEILVSGTATSTQFNRFNWFQIEQKIMNLLLRNIPQTFDIPLSYYGSLQASYLSLGHLRDNLRIPEDLILTKNTSETIVITGEKYFENSISVSNIDLDSNSLINGLNFSTFFDDIVKLNSQNQSISGRKTFTNLIIDGDVFVADGRINGHNLIDAIDINAEGEQYIRKPLNFLNIIVDNDLSIKIQELKLNRTLNGINYKKFLRNLIRRPSNRIPIIEIHNKHFPDDLVVHKILINGTMNGIDLHRTLSNSFVLNSNQNVSGRILFKNATFYEVDAFKTINGFNRQHFDQIVRKDSPTIHIDASSLESTLGNWLVKNLNVRNINGNNITDINLRTLKKYSLNGQTITSKHIFLKPTKISNLNLPIESGKINNVPLNSYVWLQSPTLIFDQDILFKNIQRLQNLTVLGQINQCFFNNIIDDFIVLNPSSSTFDLNGSYNLSEIIVNGNANFHSNVNAKPSFVRDLIPIDDERPFKHSIRFLEDVTVKQIQINNLINDLNISILLNDAVYAHKPQRILGTKKFKKSLKIIGNIQQSKGQLSLRNSFNQLNLTELFETSVKIHNERSISGNKIFTGNITFGNIVSLRGGMNGLRFPDDFVLTYTNETILGRVNFNRKVQIRNNLNVELINHINISQFVSDIVLLNETIPRQISSAIRFVNPIRINNLTVHRHINDISVEDLVKNSDDLIEIRGLKSFQNDIVVDGFLNVKSNLINNIHLVRDIQNEWIDCRSSNALTNMSGEVVFENEISADEMIIEKRLNDLSIDHFQEHLKTIENEIDLFRASAESKLRETRKNENLLAMNFTKNILFDLKYFKMHRYSLRNYNTFYPITDGLVMRILIATNRSNSAKDCTIQQQLRNGFFSFDTDGNLLEHSMPVFWINASMIITQSNSLLAIVLFDSNYFCSNVLSEQSYSLQLWNSFQFLSLLDESEEITTSIFTLTFTLPSRSKIVSIKLFQNSYLLIHYRIESNSKSGKMKLFKLYQNRLEELDSLQSTLSVNHFDLLETKNLTLLSIVPNGNSNQTLQLYYWNSSIEGFRIYSSYNAFNQHYYYSKILALNNRLLVLYSRSSSEDCYDYSMNMHSIDVFEIFQYREMILMRFFQQIVQKFRVENILYIDFESDRSFLLIQSKTLDLFRLDRMEKIKWISKFRLPGTIRSVSDSFWIHEQNLYLMVTSADGNSWILSAIIGGRSDRSSIFATKRITLRPLY